MSFWLIFDPVSGMSRRKRFWVHKCVREFLMMSLSVRNQMKIRRHKPVFAFRYPQLAVCLFPCVTLQCVDLILIQVKLLYEFTFRIRQETLFTFWVIS